MDFQGQGRAELFYQIIILVTTIVGAIVAYINQQFSIAIYSHLFGLGVASILCLPPWPIYKRKPIKWLPAVDLGDD